MNGTRARESFFEIPHAIVFVLVTLNVAAYGLCLNQSGGFDISSETLFRNGAMYSLAIERNEYWRLVAYGFLHANLFHLVTNMLCLALWGAHLEKRIGSLYFVLVYACALIAAAVVSDFTHARAYLTVGASGGVSGILGALLCLWILGKINASASFFVTNIGINVALAFTSSRIDWGAHLGGFVAGMIACALLDVFERAAPYVFRCKFPEFVKMNIFVIAVVSAAHVLPVEILMRQERLLLLAGFVILCLAITKLLDVLLSVKKGLAVVVIMLSTANAVLVPLVALMLRSGFIAKCGTPRLPEASRLEELLGAACGAVSIDLAVYVLAVGAFALTLLAYWSDFHRGLGDVGFVGASLRAERRRRRGL